MKFLIVIAAFGLVGCCPPNIRPDFPSIPPSLEIQCPELAYVAEVVENSAADKAGIKKEDVIIKVNDIAVKSPSQLQDQIS